MAKVVKTDKPSKTDKTARERLLPYRLLAYLLYSASKDWLELVMPGQIRVTTGPAARAFRMKIFYVWESLYWLEKNGLVEKVQKERKRGTALVTLKTPGNIRKELENV